MRALVISCWSSMLTPRSLQVHGKTKQGASHVSTRQLGLHPLAAVRAGTGEILHVRTRKGSANTARGAVRFVTETMGRVRRAGATGRLLWRFDSGLKEQRADGAHRG